MVQDRKIARRVRLADVAAEAGVSSMTVSEILRPRNSRIQVSEKTRLRVLEAVKRLNYQPNLQARSLADGRSSLVGILFSSLQDPFFAELLNHLEQELRRHNLTGIYAFWSDYEHFEQALNTVICNNVCGIVTSHDELGERVPDSIPTVVYGYPHEKYDSIYPDWEEIMKMIFRHLYERGYRKFGYAGHWATRKTRQVEKMARETFDEVLKRRDGYTQEEVDEARQEILDRLAVERMASTSSMNTVWNRIIWKI